MEHAASVGQVGLQVTKRATSTAVSCKPKTVRHGKSTVCRATVTDTSGGIKSSPKGKVKWSARKSYGAFKTKTCKLVTLNGKRTCKVTFKTSRKIRGAIKLKSTYAGDANHRPSSRTARVKVT